MNKNLLLLPLLALAACGSEEQPAYTAKEPSPVELGKALFQQNCSVCHLVKADAAGPALQGVVQRWGNDTARLIAYIHNPQKLIDEKDPNAVEAYEKWKPTVMTPFPQLSDQDIKAILAYIQSEQ
jgi:mono/diheme cytochrome c family protein